MMAKSTGQQASFEFSAGMAGLATLTEIRTELWRLMRLVMTGGRCLDNLRLVRWDDLRVLHGTRWAAMAARVADTVRGEIEGHLAPGGSCIRYDDSSLMVICADPVEPVFDVLADRVARIIGKKFTCAPVDNDLIQVWKPVSMEDRGFAFERLDAPASSRPSMAASEEAAAETEVPPASSGRSLATMVLTDAEFRYSPLWDVRENAVFCYLCEASWDANPGAAVPAEALASPHHGLEWTLTLDLETLRKAIEELELWLDQYCLAKLLIPVHYEILADPGTAETYTRFCNGKIWPVREFAYFEIVVPPSQITKEELAVVAQRLKPFGRGIMLRVPMRFRQFDRVPADEILAVGMDRRLDERPENGIIADLKAFATDARSIGLRTYGHGLLPMSLSAAAACGGIDFIGGAAIDIAFDEWEPDDEMIKPLDLLKTLLARAEAGAA